MKDNPTEAYIIKQMILSTIDHADESMDSMEDSLILDFKKADLGIFMDGSVSDMIEMEKKVFREYGFMDFSLYKEKRLEVLKNLESYILKYASNGVAFSEYIVWFKHHQPNIAVFAGSFNPVHIGHINILKKAESIFDKVILLKGHNPSKNGITPVYDFKQMMDFFFPSNQTVVYDGMLHEYVFNLGYPVTIVKGLRNPSDFDAEKLQLRYMQDFMPDVKVVYIVPDREFEHISSSAIRQIDSIKGGDSTRYRIR